MILHTLRTALLACFVLISCAEAAQHVLLHNGNVVSGEVRLVDQQYRVTNPGSEMRLRPETVALVANSPAELYDFRRRQMASPVAAQHLQLAEWCIRNELWNEAARELLDARQLALGQSSLLARIEVAERRLFEARRLAEEATNQPSSQPRFDPEVAAAVYQSEPQEPNQQPTQEPIIGASGPALELFTRKIQPILVNNCTVAGCHAPDGGEAFRLNRDLLHGMANQESTAANLRAVLLAIDAKNPAESPLLAAMLQPHAGSARPLFSGRKALLARTVGGWVAEVTNYRPPAVQPAEQPTSPPADQVPTPAEIAAATNLPPADFPLGDDEFAPLESQPAEIKHGMKLETWEPRDEFDPELFNRKYRGL